MKRLVIFAVLFPPLALVVFLWREISTDWRLPPAEFVSTAYLIASLPAWLTAAVDWGLSKKLPRLRVPGTTLAAFAIAVVFARIVGHDFSFPNVLHIGVMGAIPGAICSLLSTERA